MPTPPVAITVPVATLPPEEKAKPFHWSQIEDKDYRPFVQHLRGIGCPEDVVRDILATEAWCAFQGLSTEGPGPWDLLLAGLPDRTKAREIATFVNEILGAPTLALDEQAFDKKATRVTSAVPAVSETAAKAEADFVTGMNAVWTRIGGRVPTPAEHSEIYRVQDARDSALAAIMTEPERERYEAERSGNLPRLRSELAELKLADEEALTLLRLQGYEREARTAGASLDDPEMAELAESRSQALRELLGEDRYAAYARLQDSTYVTLRDLGKQHGLNPESVVQAYELLKNRTGEATPESMPFDARLKDLLGDEGFNEWVQLGNGERAVMANAAAPQNSDVSDRSGGDSNQARR